MKGPTPTQYCTGRQSPNHRTTRELPNCFFTLIYRRLFKKKKEWSLWTHIHQEHSAHNRGLLVSPWQNLSPCSSLPPRTPLMPFHWILAPASPLISANVPFKLLKIFFLFFFFDCVLLSKAFIKYNTAYVLGILTMRHMAKEPRQLSWVHLTHYWLLEQAGC